jgi:hypothetical protein
MAADIVIDTVTLPDGVVGVPYEAALAYHGNATALSAMTISSGSKPTGLTKDNALPFCRLTGTPLASDIGTWTFKVTLTDTAGAVQSVNYTINIRTAASVAGPDRPFSSFPVVAQMAATWPS